MRLQSYLSGQWRDGTGPGSALVDPVTGEELARASGDGLDVGAALAHARTVGAPALGALSFGQRAQMLAAMAAVLTDNRAKYAEIALRNSGNTAGDAAFDIDGGIGTLKYYASVGRKLGEARLLAEAGDEQLGKDEEFRAAHLWSRLPGVAVHINAFNFPSWGLWEKAAVALLAGMPMLAKPATATAWLAAEMVRDVIAAAILPEGALSLLVGGGRDLMDHLAAGDVVAFTGSADTGLMLRSHRGVLAAGVRFSVEADSLNLACLGPDADPASDSFAGLVREVTREMTVKAGQKCTAIRRVLVPRPAMGLVIEALTASLAKVAVGDPRDPAVRMGPLVNKAQRRAALEGIGRLAGEARLVLGGGAIGAETACFVAPTVLACERPDQARLVHELEVFGPAVTVLPYDDPAEAARMARRGGGSLVASLFSADTDFAATLAVDIAASHGRVLVVDPAVAKSQTGHGVVMPQCVHGGPGRAGGGEELGGLRGLRLYCQRTALQGSRALLARVREQAAVVAL